MHQIELGVIPPVVGTAPIWQDRAEMKTSGYARETDLVESFAQTLRSGKTPWGPVEVTFEFDYIGGHADILALRCSGEVIAFEAKLIDWRHALHQAYRTRCFADRAYIVVPERTAGLASRHRVEFERRKVGICSLSNCGAIEVLRDADNAVPLQPWMTARAREALASNPARRTQNVD